MNRFRTHTLSVLALTLGLALPGALLAREGPAIERVDSRDAHVAQVELKPTSTGVKAQGYLQKRPSGRGAIPGHLHVELFGADDALLGEGVASYHRRNHQAQKSHFDKEIPVTADRVERVRVTHHGLRDRCAG